MDVASDVPVNIRWTPRRIRVTAAYSFVGFLIGIFMTPVLMTPILFGISNPFSLLVATPIAVMIGAVVVGASAKGTCRKTPAGPVGIAVGLLAGALAITLYATSMNPPPHIYFLGPLLGAAQAFGGYRGAISGLRECLGKPVHGVGIVCAHCGYDLSSTEPGWKCPECGGEWRYPSREMEL